MLPFPPLPIQVRPVPQPRQTGRVPAVIGLMVGVGLIVLLIAVVPWGLVLQALTNSVDSLSDQVKQVQFAQVKQSQKVAAPPEVSTPATSKVETAAPTSAVSAPATLTDETAPTPEASMPAASTVETTTASEVSTPETPIVEAPSTSETPVPTTSSGETSSVPEVLTPAPPPTEAASATSFSEPDSRFLVGRYPVRKYTDIRHKIAPGETLYSFIRVYGDRIFPKKYRDWELLARYNNIRPPQYIMTPGAVLLIPTLEYIVLPKTGYGTELSQIQLELAKQPNNPELLNQRAVIHFKRNELNQARSTLRQGIRSSPNNSVLHNNLGFIYLIIEDDKRAQSEFEFAITHSEKPAISHCNLGILYMTMEKFDPAIRAFENALEVDANLLDAKYNLALAHEKVGNVDSAREHLRELNQLLSDDPEVASALERLTSSQVTGE